jgi:hypothetical protein
MDSAVQLDDKPKLIAAEVRNEAFDRKLSPELEPSEASMAEELPQSSLGRSGLSAKLTRSATHLVAF